MRNTFFRTEAWNDFWVNQYPPHQYTRHPLKELSARRQWGTTDDCRPHPYKQRVYNVFQAHNHRTVPSRNRVNQVSYLPNIQSKCNRIMQNHIHIMRYARWHGEKILNPRHKTPKYLSMNRQIPRRVETSNRTHAWTIQFKNLIHRHPAMNPHTRTQ